MPSVRKAHNLGSSNLTVRGNTPRQPGLAPQTYSIKVDLVAVATNREGVRTLKILETESLFVPYLQVINLWDKMPFEWIVSNFKLSDWSEALNSDIVESLCKMHINYEFSNATAGDSGPSIVPINFVLKMGDFGVTVTGNFSLETKQG